MSVKSTETGRNLNGAFVWVLIIAGYESLGDESRLYLQDALNINIPLLYYYNTQIPRVNLFITTDNNIDIAG